MEDRTTYFELKEWFLEDAFRWCQRKFRDGKINKWIGNETEWGALYSFENSFDTPIENLMLYTIAVITDAGRDKVYYSNWCNGQKCGIFVHFSFKWTKVWDFHYFSEH